MSAAYQLFGELRVDSSHFTKSLREAEQRLLATEKAISNTENKARSLGQTSATSARSNVKLTESVTKQRERLVHLAGAYAKGEINSKQFTSALKGVGNATTSVNSRLKDSQARMTEFANRISKLADRMKTLGAGIVSVGQSLTIALTAPLTALGYAAVKSAADFQSLRMGLVAVTGSSEEAAAQIIRLKEVAKLPGLGLKEAIQGSINLQAAGLSANTAERALKAFGNALATVGKGKSELDGVITALTQIQSKGKISAEEINQLAERLPQIRVAMQNAFGTADTEVLSKMGISSAQFVEAITTEFEKLPAVTASAKGSFENFTDSLGLALAPIGDAILPILIDGIDTLTPIIEDLASSFSNLSPITKTVAVVFGSVLAVIGPIAIAIGTMIPVFATVASGIAAAAAAAGGLAPLIGLIAAAAVGLAIQFAPVIAVAAVWYAAWKTNFGGIRDLVTNIAGKIGEAWESMKSKITVLTQSLLGDIKAFWIENGNDITKAVQKVSAVVRSVWEGVAKFWAQHGETIKTVAKAAWETISTVVKSALNVVLNIIKGVTAVINGDWSKAWSAAKAIAISAVNGIEAVAKGMGTILVAAARGAFNAIWTLHGWILAKALSIGKAVVEGIVNGIRGGIPRVAEAAASLASVAYEAAKQKLGIASPSKGFSNSANSRSRGFSTASIHLKHLLKAQWREFSTFLI